MSLAENAAKELTYVKGPVLTASDPEYAAEIRAFNVATVHKPEVVIGVTNTDDVVEAVRFARKHNASVNVQCTGHGADTPITSGVFISTKRLDHIKIDPEARTVTFGAGTLWRAVLNATAEHGLFPIVGSALHLGAVGYLLGGGLGPLARSHGYSSDYIVRAQVVTGEGVAVDASATQNTDLFWAVRGGKRGFGVVTEVTMRLVELRTVYGGALLFEEAHVETVLRAWTTWTQTAHAQVTTSVALVDFPPFEAIPPFLRARRILFVRFAFPGSKEEGEKLVAPLRAAAPIYKDTVAEIPVTEIGKVHNDNERPTPVWNGSQFLNNVDQDFVSVFLKTFAKGPNAPFMIGEIRHIGGATQSAQGNASNEGAVGGREANFAFTVLSLNPALFTSHVHVALKSLREALNKWVTPETNINFLEAPNVLYSIAHPWALDRLAKLREVRLKYDPSGLFSQFCQ
jgi:hypothetical protein